MPLFDEAEYIPFDFKPILDHHRQVFFQKIREGKFLDGYNRYRGTLK